MLTSLDRCTRNAGTRPSPEAATLVPGTAPACGADIGPPTPLDGIRSCRCLHRPELSAVTLERSSRVDRVPRSARCREPTSTSRAQRRRWWTDEGLDATMAPFQRRELRGMRRRTMQKSDLANLDLHGSSSHGRSHTVAALAPKLDFISADVANESFPEVISHGLTTGPFLVWFLRAVNEFGLSRHAPPAMHIVKPEKSIRKRARRNVHFARILFG